MAKIKISNLELNVMTNFNKFCGLQNIPQNMLVSSSIKANQLSAVLNNMVAKGLVSRSKDLFGTTFSLTRSGKIQSTKAIKRITV